MPQNFKVGRKPKSISAPSTNGQVNGAPLANGIVGKRKRDADEAELEEQHESKKRGKVKPSTLKDELIVLDDASNGAIVID